ncbi:DUF1294 domain-containing protein [Enterococcus saccharolyticus]|uniref:DUF1294 domain-containing protein n=1 Tax=Candidatus Enterococcus willemsii TaxID=1857215 RepID=A0ABQ6YZY5_9ENTE|nr:MULTISPECIES: DUF1294 domain-containing protein [Enterococcus]KAF1303821.1 hypothetical protein BAU17_13575 [Enterococcus sp. CU12B]MCD5003472.1 DUF1294 domain-containing protein [Enterococcus saccharolyticus]
MNHLFDYGIILYLFLINTYVFLVMWYDKRQAERKKWRIPEARILMCGVLGGGLGGLLARSLFRHKTRKTKFLFCFLLGVVLDIVLLYLS